MHTLKKSISVNVKRRKKFHSSVRFFILSSKLSFFFFFKFFSFFEFFSSVCAFVDALFSIFKKLSNSDKDFKMKMFANDVVSLMWNTMNVRACKFFTLTFSNIIVFEFIFFFENSFNYFFIFIFSVDFSSTLIIFLFFFFSSFIHLLQRCRIEQLNHFDNSFFRLRQTCWKTTILAQVFFY